MERWEEKFFIVEGVGFAEESRVPGRCFREARGRPHAQSKLSSPKQRLKVKEAREGFCLDLSYKIR
jgi:hypothetical protein